MRTIQASALGAFIIDLCQFMAESSAAEKNIYADKTYTWAWALVSLIIVTLILSKLRVRPGPYLLMIFVGTLLYACVWHPLLETVSLMKPNYFGIVPLGFNEPQQNSQTARQESLSFLYTANDPDLTSSITTMRSEGREFKIKKFLFWQTGIGFGFGQRGLPSFYELRGYRFYRLALIATVGPVVLAECFIKGMIKVAAFIVLIQWIWFILRKRHLLIKD